MIAIAPFHFSEQRAFETTPRKLSLLNEAYRGVNGLKKEEEYATLLSLLEEWKWGYGYIDDLLKTVCRNIEKIDRVEDSDIEVRGIYGFDKVPRMWKGSI